LITLNRTRSFVQSVCKMLSARMPRSNRCRRAILGRFSHIVGCAFGRDSQPRCAAVVRGRAAGTRPHVARDGGLVSWIGCFNVFDLVNLLIESESKNAA